MSRLQTTRTRAARKLRELLKALDAQHDINTMAPYAYNAVDAIADYVIALQRHEQTDAATIKSLPRYRTPVKMPLTPPGYPKQT